MERGRPAVSMMVAPVKKAKLETIYDKLLSQFRDSAKENPLTLKEAIRDTTQQTLTRNYGHEIDRWMPKIGEEERLQPARLQKNWPMLLSKTGRQRTRSSRNVSPKVVT